MTKLYSHLVFGAFLATCTTFGVGSAHAQSAFSFPKTTPVPTTPKAELAPKGAAKAARAASASGASYDLPVTLSNLGTINTADNVVCNRLFRHKAINGGAFYLASSDKEVTYKNTSTDGYTSCKWNVPGADTVEVTTTDATVQYSAPGIYAMPTLTTTSSTGTSTYKSDYTIKVGGQSEVTTIDCREWFSTYLLSALTYGEQGYMGGTNSVDLVGFGNLFMLGTEESMLDGVNIYLLKKPTMYEEGAKLKVQVWMTNIDGTNANLTYYPIEGTYYNMADIKTDDDGVWTPIDGGAVMQIRFSESLDLYGKNPFFVSVEGFGSDPTKEDFCLLTDIYGKSLDEVTASNLLAHNSFARLSSETSYLRPISSYGGGTGSFAICPIISIPGDGTGISDVTTQRHSFVARMTSDTTIEVASAADGKVTVADQTGRTIATGTVSGGKATISVPALSGHGLYIVSGPNHKTAKILK